VAALVALIGPVSIWMFFTTTYRLVFEYIVLPLVKDAYIFPEWRYRIFDAVLIACCCDGLIASFLLIRTLGSEQNASPWTGRTTLLFFVGVAVLAAGVTFGVSLRNRGL